MLAPRRTQTQAVLYGRCYEEPLGPYQPFAEALADHVQGAGLDAADLGAGAEELARLSPRLADRLGVPAASEGDAAEGAHFRLFEAVVSMLEHSVRRSRCWSRSMICTWPMRPPSCSSAISFARRSRAWRWRARTVRASCRAPRPWRALSPTCAVTGWWSASP